MKRRYLCFLWLLVCLVLPLQGQAISQTELLDTARFQHIDSTVDSGRGDGKYLDLTSVRSVEAPNGHRRIEATVYVLMPAADLIYGLQIQYDYQMDQSLNHLIDKHDTSLRNGGNDPYISIWYAKQSNSGITGTITSANAFNNDGQTHKQQIHMANINAILLPVEFGNEKYKLPNLVYQKAYGIAYDDEL